MAFRNPLRNLSLASSRELARLVSGRYRSSIHGNGIEFSDLREYAPGDEVRAIDWSTSARTGHTYIKLFREERSMPIYFCVDTGLTMRLGSTDRTKLDTAHDVVSTLSAAARESNDPYTIIAYDAGVHPWRVPARGATPGILGMRMLDHIAHVEPSGIGNMPEILRHLSSRQTRHALIFLLSDEIESLDTRRLRILAEKNDIVLVTILDSFERGAIGSTGFHHISTAAGDTFLSRLGVDKTKQLKIIRHERLAMLAKTTQALKIRHLVLDERDTVDLVLYRFFERFSHISR